MAVRPILQHPNPILRQKAPPITEVSDPIIELAFDMVDTVLELNAVGLAANQVGVLHRMVVVRLLYPPMLYVLVNPVVVARNGLRKDYEHCLSCPTGAVVWRSVWVKCRATLITLNSNPNQSQPTCNVTMNTIISSSKNPYFARVLQHELDHLDGILILDKGLQINKGHSPDVREQPLFEEVAPRITQQGGLGDANLNIG